MVIYEFMEQMVKIVLEIQVTTSIKLLNIVKTL